jgi:hypothetical protein
LKKASIISFIVGINSYSFVQGNNPVTGLNVNEVPKYKKSTQKTI